MPEKLKYRVVVEDDVFEFEQKINALADEGYSIRHTMDSIGQILSDSLFIAVMGLKSEVNIEAVKKVSHGDVENHIGANGWEVFGIYANHTLLVRRRE